MPTDIPPRRGVCLLRNNRSQAIRNPVTRRMAEGGEAALGLDIVTAAELRFVAQHGSPRLLARSALSLVGSGALHVLAVVVAARALVTPAWPPQGTVALVFDSTPAARPGLNSEATPPAAMAEPPTTPAPETMRPDGAAPTAQAAAPPPGPPPRPHPPKSTPARSARTTPALGRTHVPDAQALVPSAAATPGAGAVSPIAATTAARPLAGLAGNGRPDYPPAARRRGEQGTVLLRITVTADGRASAALVERSSGSAALDAAARDKVLRDWRFVPASRDGTPVAGEAIQSMSFSLAP